MESTIVRAVQTRGPQLIVRGPHGDAGSGGGHGLQAPHGDRIPRLAHGPPPGRPHRVEENARRHEAVVQQHRVFFTETGIFAYIEAVSGVNVGKYAIHVTWMVFLYQ